MPCSSQSPQAICTVMVGDMRFSFGVITRPVERAAVPVLPENGPATGTDYSRFGSMLRLRRKKKKRQREAQRRRRADLARWRWLWGLPADDRKDAEATARQIKEFLGLASAAARNSGSRSGSLVRR